MEAELDIEVELVLRRRELALLQRAEELRKENAIEFYVPHPKQELFHSNGGFHYRYARTGNRFGKSEMGAVEDVAFALGYRPWIPEGEPLRTLGIPPHPTKGLIITTDWKKSEEIFTATNKDDAGPYSGMVKGKLFRYIPKAALGRTTRNHSGVIDSIDVRHVSGSWSTIHLDTVQSFKQNAMGQESSFWDWIHVDEPIPEKMWKANVRGLTDRKGKAWFTCTPIAEPWIDEAFVPNLEDQTKDILGETSDAATSRWMMTGSMDDNPHNTPESIALTMSWYTDEEKEARRKGIPTAYAGLVYKEFEWSKHVRAEPPVGWTSWDEPPADHCIYIAIDYHFRKNNAVSFIAVPPDGPAYYYAELWQQMLLEEEVVEIRNVLRGRPYQPILMDPLASTPNKVTDITAMDEYRRHGLAVLPATKDPVNGVRSVKANLKARGRDGSPTLIFNPACRRTLFEIARGFVWDGENNRPIKNNDDMMENLYRLHLQGLTYIEPAADDEYYLPTVRDIPDNLIELPYFADEAKPAVNQRYALRYRS